MAVSPGALGAGQLRPLDSVSGSEAIQGPSPWCDVANVFFAGGAKGTGDTVNPADDSAAFQAATDYAHSNPGGGLVFFGPFNFRLNSNIKTYPNVSYITYGGTLTGLGAASVVPTTVINTIGTVVPSLTVTQPGGPGTAVLPGDATTPTPNGVVTGKVWDYGGMAYHAKAAGVTGDGTTDDAAKLNAVLITAAGNGPVVMSVGTYRITISLTLPVAFAGLIGPNKGQAVIKPSAQTFAAFINAAGFGGGWSVENITVDYGVATGNVVATNPAAAAFSITGAGAAPSQYTLKNIVVNYAYYGYFDTSISNLVTLEHYYANTCNTGFLKNTGTTFIWRNCFAVSCSVGWNCNGCLNSLMEACAVQSCTAFGLQMTNMHGLAINGLDMESNVLAGNNAALMVFANCQGFALNGVRNSLNTFATGGNTQYIFYFNSGCEGVVNGASIGSVVSDTATGAGGSVIAVNFDASANKVAFAGGRLSAPTAGSGAPTVSLASIGNAAGQSITFLDVERTGSVNDPGNWLKILDSAGSTLQGPLALGGHFINTLSGAPVTSALGANVTSVIFSGNDRRGTITIVMAGALARNTRIATCTFVVTYGANAPIVFFFNQTSGNLALVNLFRQAFATGVSFDIASDQALAAGTYTFGYIVEG